LLAIFDRVQLRKDFLNIVSCFFFRHIAPNLSALLGAPFLRLEPVFGNLEQTLRHRPDNHRAQLQPYRKPN